MFEIHIGHIRIYNFIKIRKLKKTRRMLRYASRFHGKKFRKQIQKIFRDFFSNFFGDLSSTANLRYACKNFGGLGPLVWP
jgi:hypothetical protein